LGSELVFAVFCFSGGIDLHVCEVTGIFSSGLENGIEDYPAVLQFKNGFLWLRKIAGNL